MGGWEPREFHAPQYEPVWWNPISWFRPVGVIVTREPEWDQESVDLLAAHLAAEASKGAHGIPMDRATRKGAKFTGPAEPTHDLAQKDMARRQRKYYKANPDADRDGDLWSVEEVPD